MALNATYAKQKLNLLNSKTSRENTNANLKTNSSPNRFLDENQHKKIHFHETLKIKKDGLTKKILGHAIDTNNSSQHNNERLYMNQTLKTGNVLNNKSNEFKAKHSSISIDRNDPQFSSNKLHQNNQDNRSNKSTNDQKGRQNKQINSNSNVNMNSKLANPNAKSNDSFNNDNVKNNNKNVNLNYNNEDQKQDGSRIGTNVFTLNVN